MIKIIIKKFQLLAVILIILNSNLYSQQKSSLCFTFDDGSSKDVAGYDYLEWNKMILDNLSNNNLQAILYVCGNGLDNIKGKKILNNWDNAGHLIANHTYSHLNYNNHAVNYKLYKADILKCDSLIKNYKNYSKLFRAPFLKNGNTIEKRDSLISYLKHIKYKNGYVTIDASDWYFNSELIKFIKNHPHQSVEKYKLAYISHLLNRAKYYDDLAFELFGRKVKHSILLHHNLTSALFLGDLITAFKENGWSLINAHEALTDEIYNRDIKTMPAGESIIWSAAKESGKYDNLLRYPAEDSIYEESKLKEFGLL
ncbi:MAG: polysaccharide deacetylase family protein [bacterium]